MSIFAVTVGESMVRYDDVACAGAICSVSWRGHEFINAGDDGRLLQTALTTDNNEEAYNPTEGGSLHAINFAAPSDSLCIESEKGANWFRTVNRMALWQSGQLSDFILCKRVTIADKFAVFDLKISTPATLVRLVQDKIEWLTGYMPPTFSTFFALNRELASVSAISDGPGEQERPVILSAPDGSYAMGGLIPAWGDAAATPVCGYGRWRFTSTGCVKWNCVQRVPTPPPGIVHRATVNVAWGTLADAVNGLSTALGVQTGQVRRLYWATLDRAPDAGGMTNCLAQLHAGSSLTQLAVGFIGSPEFTAKYGNTDDTAFVTLLYANVLGRAPDAPGLQYQLAQLAAGRSRAQIVVDFSESPEFQIKQLLAGSVYCT